MEPNRAAAVTPSDWDAIRPERKPRRSETQQTVVVRLAGLLSASVTFHGPLLRYAGAVWDSVFLTVTAYSAPVGTLQPQVVGADGVAYDVGKSVSLSGRVLTAGVPVRCHDENRLSKRIPAESVLLLKVTVTGGSLTNATFHFVTTRD